MSAERAAVYEGFQLGLEATIGTPVAAGKRLQSLTITPKPQEAVEAVMEQGYNYAVDTVTGKRHTGGGYKGRAAYNDIAYIFSSLLGACTPSTPAGNGTWTLDLDTPTSGTFTLTFNGQTTSALAFDIVAADLKTALEGISSTGVVTVTGGPGNTTAFTITFTGYLANTDLAITGNFASLVGGAAAAVTSATATTSRRWKWTPARQGGATPKAFTMVKGQSGQGAARFAHGMFNSLELTLNKAGATVSGNLLGKRYQEGLEVQSVVITEGAGGDTFTLTYGGQTTAAVAFDVAIADLQTALEAVSTIGTGNVLVAGSASNYVISIQGTLKNLVHTAITGLGTGCTVTVGNAATTATDVVLAPVVAEQIGWQAGATLAALVDLSNTVLEFKAQFGDHWEPQFYQDSSDDSFGGVAEKGLDLSGTLTLKKSTEGNADLQRTRARTARYFRVTATGPAIETGYNYLLQLTFALKFKEPDYADQDGAYAQVFGMVPVYAADLGGCVEVVVQNRVSSL